MEIQEIKQRLSITTVLSHYGLQADKNHRLCCPFHADKTPSMQVYENTNTVYCFSASCQLHGKAIDTIDFIMHKENLTKHEAIKKASSLAGEALTMKAQEVPLIEATARIAVLTKLLYESQESLKKSAKAQGYCKERGLKLEGIGYLEERYHRSWNETLKQSAIAIGLLKEMPNKRLGPVFRNCVVFFMKNSQGQVVNLYGRSIADNSNQKHFYLKGKHQGLYPGYPSKETKTLILTESLIDAASLLQLKAIENHYSVLALYGTNGLTDEHRTAIKGLTQIEEVIFLLDQDEAGRKATALYGQELQTILPSIRISRANLPQGEDVNSVLQSHEEAIITHVLKERTLLLSSEKTQATEVAPIKEEHSYTAESLNTANAEKIVYEQEGMKIEVWGGLDYGNLHRMKLSLYLEKEGRSFRDDVNLYSHRNKKSFIEDASVELDISESTLKPVVDSFIRAVEHYRLQEQNKRKTLDKLEVPRLNETQVNEAINTLKDEQLTQTIRRAMQLTGLIGETDKGLLLFLIFLTRFFDHSLHALVHGSSGSGKTNLLKSILKLVPQESKYETTALTENVLFRPPYKAFWKHKILLLEDLDGSYKALYPLREFMSNQHISKFVSEADAKTGQFKQVLLEAEGPIVIAGATTKDKVYEDNSNRSFLLHVDESKNHQEKILDYQNRKAAGLIDKEGEEEIVEKIHHLQRVLDPSLKVINPFQPSLKLPEYVFKKLRTNTHYITLIKSVTFLYQYQRERKTDRHGNVYIETTLADIALANRLSKESLLRKSDELSGEVREFFESLKYSVKQNKQTAFTAREIREKFRMHPMKLKRRLDELTARGYIKKIGGNRKVSYEYEVVSYDDYKVLEDGLKLMDEVLDKLWEEYPDGRYKTIAKEKAA